MINVSSYIKVLKDMYSRGQLIINVYNINGAIRRWSDLDVKLLSDLFRQLYFNVIVYSDFNGDDLGAEV